MVKGKSNMKLKELVNVLSSNSNVVMHIMLPNGDFVAEHFHITEVGVVNKDFIDCGGTKRSLRYCTLQVWTANDFDHRLKTDKLEKIIKIGKSLFDLEELPVEIEYGSEYISQYPLADVEVTPKGLLFVLGAKKTCCLAPDKCGVKGCC
jgi:hypothetical protein